MMDEFLIPFFHPRGVVVIGASTNPVKPGYGSARNVVQSGYKGAIHFVSQKPGTLFDHPIHTNLAEVPDPVDLAVIIVPSPGVPEAVNACGKRGIRAVIILSGGFKEIGPEGEALEAEVMQIARSYGIRVIGPNCVGLSDTHLPIDTSFLPPPTPAAGNVAIISQSGAILLIIIDWARTEGLGFSRLMSLGNKADIVEADVLSAAVEPEQTGVLGMYIEALVDGPRFIEEAWKAVRRKPVVALKVGRYPSGQRAAASHTGALAGSDAAYQAAFERAGILRASTSEELFDWIMTFAYCPLPGGRRVAILTNSGGPGVIASDAVEASGLKMAVLSASTVVALKEFLPPASNFLNPVDMLGGSSPQDYARGLSLLLADPDVDAVIVLLPAPPMFPAEDVAEAIIPLIHASQKPVLVTLMGQDLVAEAHSRFRKAKVAVYPFVERAVAALDKLADRYEFEHIPDPVLPQLSGIDKFTAEEAMSTSPTGAWLEPEPVQRLMAAYGIPSAPLKLARTAEAASAFASELGFPLVVKVASPDILHKSDMGGVLLGIDSSSAASDAFRTVVERVRLANPSAKIDGVYIQQMIQPGQEVIIGAVRDPVFGMLMMFGSGGVEVEGLKDISFALTPLMDVDVERMLSRTWAGRKLGGFRSIPPADQAAVKDILLRLSQLAADFPEISEIEINPLRILAPGKGAVAVDVRVRL